MVDKATFEMMQARRDEQLEKGWIGVDFDGTLAEYWHWDGWNVFGKPILPMVYRVRRWLGEGHEVKLMTARIGVPVKKAILGDNNTPSGWRWAHSETKSQLCRVTGAHFSNKMMADALADYTEEHVGARLDATCIKDLRMIELWDDRCIQVEANTGRTVFDEWEAEYAALAGKTYGQ